MNYHSDKWIMSKVREHYKEAKNFFPEKRILSIFYQGSGNYGLDVESSDVDTKLIVLPSLHDLILNEKRISTTHIRENNEHIDFKDLQLYFDCFRKQNLNFMEILYTKYCIINFSYADFWENILSMRDKIVRYDEKKTAMTIYGMSKQKHYQMCHIMPHSKELIQKYGYEAKQLIHLIRLNDFIHKYIAGKPYKECMTPSDTTILMHIAALREYKYSLSEAVSIADYYLSNTNEIVNDYLIEKKDAKPNKEVDKFLDDMAYKIIVSSFER